MKFSRAIFFAALLLSIAFLTCFLFYSNKINSQMAKRTMNNPLISSGSHSNDKRRPLIVIDPGHGGPQNGAPEDILKEKDLNLAIALNLKEKLSKESVDIIMTRQDDKDVDLFERVRIANDSNADLFLSIHNNWFPDESIHGTTTLYSSLNTNISGKSLDSKQFASIMNHSLVNDLQTRNFGIEVRNDLVVIKYTTMPSVLVEIVCLSNPGERSRAKNPAFVEKAAASLHSGLAEALGRLNQQ